LFIAVTLNSGSIFLVKIVYFFVVSFAKEATDISGIEFKALISKI